jgi:hypothetical protein
MPTDPADNRLGLVAPDAADNANVPSDLQAIIDQLDASAGMVLLDEAVGATPTFSGISPEFAALRLIGTLWGTPAAADAGIQFNGDTGFHYEWTTETVGSGQLGATNNQLVASGANQTFLPLGAAPTTAAADPGLFFDLLIPGYAGGTYKTVRSESTWKASALLLRRLAGRWSSGSGITDITIKAFTQALTAGSKVQLFGIG